MKISVVGLGRVGGAVAFALVSRGIPHELVLVGRTREKTVGEAYDLLHAAAFVRLMNVHAGEVADTAGSEIIVLSVNGATDLTNNRLASAAANVKLLREIVPPLAEASPGAIFVVLTNPVDICTYVALKASGLSNGKVFGTGTLIDTGRFRALLSREIGINATDIRAYILGEHGESQFPALSVASAGGVRIQADDEKIRAVFEEARRGGHEVMRNKGYTNFAVAMSALMICEAIASNSHTIFPVSTFVDNFLGVNDVCLSLPCVIGMRGIHQVLSIDLNAEEAELLRQSAAVLRGVLDRVL